MFNEHNSTKKYTGNSYVNSIFTYKESKHAKLILKPPHVGGLEKLA